MKDVGADDEAFEDDDEAVESEDEAQAPLVVSAEGYGEDRTDESDHASEGGDDLEEATENCPEGSPWDVDELKADEPEDAHDEGVERGGAPPCNESVACGF